MARPVGRPGLWHEFFYRYNIVVVYKPGGEDGATDGMSRWAYPAWLADDRSFHGSDANLEGVARWKGSEREKQPQLITANQYPTNILELRAPKGRLLPQNMQQQRERNLLLLQVNRPHNSVHYDSSSLPYDPAVDAFQSVSDHCEHCLPFPPGFCQVSVSFDGDSSSVAESSVGPDEAIWNGSDQTEDVSPLCYSERDPTWVAASLYWNLTEVNVPFETKMLYEDWRPHYRADRKYKRLLDWCLGNQVPMDGYLWANAPQWSQTHIHRDGKICVPKSIVSQVIWAVHTCAHLGQGKTLELFLRHLHADMLYARLQETVDKALSDCVVCAQAKARRGPHPDSCKPFPVPSFVFSSVAVDIVDVTSQPRLKFWPATPWS